MKPGKTYKTEYIWRILSDVFLPRMCTICEARLSPHEEAICTTCAQEFPLLHLRSYQDNALLRHLWAYEDVTRAASYMTYRHDSDSSHPVIMAKHEDYPHLGRQLGRMMARELQAKGFFESIDVIVPVPLSTLKRHRRGYNQSVQIALGVRDITGLPIEQDVLRRHHTDKAQANKDREERLQRTGHLFYLQHGERLAGKHILLLDDIFTTGMTMLSCIRTLRSAIPHATISVCTLAYSGGL